MNPNRFFATLAMLIAFAFVLPSATSAGIKIDSDQVDPGITDGTAARELAEARALWISAGIRKYRFTIRASCFCAFREPVMVAVRGRRVKLSDPDWFGPKTVPGLFKIVKGAIDREAAVLRVKYRKGTGVPRLISIDYDAMAVDEEIAYSVTKFSRIHAKPVPASPLPEQN